MKLPILALFTAATTVISSYAADEALSAIIQANDRAYEKAHANADAAVLSGFFAPDAEYTAEDGETFLGQEAIQRELKAGLAATKGAKLTIHADAVTELAPGVVLEKGRTVMTAPDGGSGETAFTAILVKHDATWKIRTLVESPLPKVNPGANLQALAWLVGDWKEQDDTTGVVVRSSYTWSRGGNYLTRNLSIQREGTTVLEGWQIIAWDPIAEGIRSWTFDGEGGFSEGRWTRDGNRWLVRDSGCSPDGSRVTSDQVFERLNENEAAWSAYNRTLDGEPMPSISRIHIQRTKGE